MRAYLSIHSFQSRASLNTWLFRIATNLSIDYMRRKKTQAPLVSLSQEGEDEEAQAQTDIPDRSWEPERMLLNKELGRRLDDALHTLPEKLRTVVILFDMEGLPYEDIAAIVGCPLGTVKSRLFNASSALREKLTPYLNA